MENIINKINDDVEAEISALLAQAKSDAKKRIDKAKADIENDSANALERARRQADARKRAEEIQVKTASRREELLSRQKAIDEVFVEVRKKLGSLSSKDEQAMISALTKKYGKPGDKVTKSGGGIVIENPNYERKLTLDELLNALRNQIELEVAKKLFN